MLFWFGKFRMRLSYWLSVAFPFSFAVKTMSKTIGIVGGVGPYAGLDIQAKILANTVAVRDQDFLPVITVSRPHEIMDRTEYLLGATAVNPAYALADQLCQLSQIGADVAGIPCNTAHAPRIFDVVKAEIKQRECPIKLLHMIEEVGHHLRQQSPDLVKIGVLSTTGTAQSGVYFDVLEPAGFTVLGLDDQLQDGVHRAIYDEVYGIKRNGRCLSQAHDHLQQAINSLRQQGAQAIILGCTELPLAFTQPQVDGIPLIDPTNILARALIRAVDHTKLRDTE